MFLTGLDVSIAECRACGYAVVHHGGKVLKPEKLYRVTIANPRQWNREGTARLPFCDGYDEDTVVSYAELHGILMKSPGMQSFCDLKNCPFSSPDENPAFVEFASLAHIVHQYQGLP